MGAASALTIGCDLIKVLQGCWLADQDRQALDLCHFHSVHLTVLLAASLMLDSDFGKRIAQRMGWSARVKSTASPVSCPLDASRVLTLRDIFRSTGANKGA
jgi:hypothetical protein